MSRSCLAIILAAGESSRMKSATSKVLHKIANKPVLQHVLDAASQSHVDKFALIVGRDAQTVSNCALENHDNLTCFVQQKRLGTGHAVLAARSEIEKGYDDILVLFADTPLITKAPLDAARAELAKGADVVVIGFRTDDPTGYGRLIEENGQLKAIREHKDASDAEKKIKFCNGGLMALSGARALELLDAIKNDNVKGEYYQTDVVEIAYNKDLKTTCIEADADEIIGINTRAELSHIERLWQNKKRQEMMLSGVTLIDPSSVYFSHDTKIEPDVTIEPNVYFGEGVSIKKHAQIMAFCHIEGAKIGEGAMVGPFARLRPEADLRAGSKVGNFCEVKKSVVGEGAKVNHLTYVGDALIGARANLGAGTITCNYDGINKHLTQIGEDAFIGTNSSLVAPVKIGDHAYVASGSVITSEVPENALAFGRAKQTNKKGLAEKIRARNLSIKKSRQIAKKD